MRRCGRAGYRRRSRRRSRPRFDIGCERDGAAPRPSGGPHAAPFSVPDRLSTHRSRPIRMFAPRGLPMDWLFTFPTMDDETLRTLKKAIDEGFRAFTRAYGESIETVFQPLQFLLIQAERLMTQTP